MVATEGKKAPAFSLMNQDAEKISLVDFAGKKVVLYFYPKDLTPGCTIEANDFNKNLAKFKKLNTVVLGVSCDSTERHQKFREKCSLNFDLLSDPEQKVCEKYGVWQEKKNYGKTYFGIVRSTFIIDEEQKILKIFSNVKVASHVEKVLEELK